MTGVAPSLRMRPARAGEEALVAGVLLAAAAGLARKGLALWEAREVDEVAVNAHVREGRYHLAVEGERAIGVFRFDLEDRLFWPEITDASSAFVHKLAVHPDRQGQQVAEALLRHACALTRERGRRVLRLDCMGGRPQLRAFYERFGFRHHGDKVLGTTVFHKFALELA